MSGEKILIVDDEPSIGDLLKIHFSEEGYTVLAAPSVDKALEMLKKGPVDLVMLDIRMPGKDGFDFLRAVSTKHGKPRMPVIVMTSRGEFESLMEGIAVDGFVDKPFEIPRVFKEVKRVLSIKKKIVYLVDSEASRHAQAIAKELREERYEVFFIKSVSSLKDCWARQPADYIVMEYEQNTIDGEDMIKEIRKCGATPLIVYSYSGMDFRGKSLRAGASTYIGTPQNPSTVVTAIREFEIK
ncbi:MAG: response regulator [Candidatus Omnitrophota bacterium]